LRSISDTIRRLEALRAAQGHKPGAEVPSRLTPLTGFGSNPGALKAWSFVPSTLRNGAPLVVVLHGCTQTAAGYDHGSGWSHLAEEQGFAVLFPEQTRANNANGCFNWFSPEDIRRDGGEASSIRQMVARMLAEHRSIDPARVFVTGLSAGGAMASVMLATYPDVFAGGAIIAGLPYGTAASVPEAFDRMRAQGGPTTPTALERLVRAASPHKGPWPTVSIWHGSADHTVVPANADAIVAQWRGLHGLGAAPSRTETVDGQTRRVWSDGTGRDVIESYSIAGMGHGTPLDPAGAATGEVAGAYMLDVGISSTRRIAAFWGIASAAPAGERVQPQRAVPTPTPSARIERAAEDADFRPWPKAAETPRPDKHASGRAAAIGKVIEDALRSAGLMR
jgi:poly(hydroxyalkanoate) depolymerase family esterase